MLQNDVGDVQTALTVLIVIGEARKLLPIDDAIIVSRSLWLYNIYSLLSSLSIGTLVSHLHRSVASLWALERGLWGDQSRLGSFRATIKSTVHHHAYELRGMWTSTWRQCGLVLRQVQVHAVGQVLCLWPDCARGLCMVSGLLPWRTHWAYAAIFLKALKVSQVWTLVCIFVTLGGSVCIVHYTNSVRYTKE